MTVLDDKLIPKALALINKYGLTATFDGFNTPSYNPATGIGVVNSQEKAVDRKVTPPEPYDTRLIDHDLIRVGDAMMFVAASGLSFLPRIGMTVTLDSEIWRVVDLGTIRTGEKIALYKLQLRH